MAKENTDKETTPAADDSVREPVPKASKSFMDMDRVLDRLFERGWMRPWRWERPLWSRPGAAEFRAPKVDVIERDKEVIVKAEVPGVERKDLDVSVTDNMITIKGQSSRESEEEEGSYYRCEIVRGAFARTLMLPSDVDADKVQAKFADGILEITLPKLERAHRRKVDIK